MKPLTPREREVSELMAQGFTDKEIARELSISPATVKHYGRDARDKLGVDRRSGMGRALATLSKDQE